MVRRSNSKIKHIIIQAGGKGSRLEYLTFNKPKALVSVNGEPLIIRQMKLYPEAKFYIISDYKSDVLEKYLSLYSPVKYEIIYARGEKTCSGIDDCVKKIPPNTPFLITWCDLYFEKEMFPEYLNVDKYNYIGLSNTFPCRWKYEKEKLSEEQSDTHGVAGIFIFKSKKELGTVPRSGEFCKALAEKEVKFRQYFLKDTHEVGTLESYRKITRKFAHTRPFNNLEIKNTIVIKRPKDAQGRSLAKIEAHWYKHHKKYSHTFLPEIHKYSPLTMERIGGDPLYKIEFSKKEKERILQQIIEGLEAIHNVEPSRKSSRKDDKMTLLTKTKKRLDSIACLIPKIDKESISINNRTCINFYKNWNLVEKMLTDHFPSVHKNIHGDLTFSNILYSKKSKKIYFIDPRGYYGDILLYGDEDYDWAKLYYSLVGNYDQFNSKNFSLKIEENNVTLDIRSNNWEHLETDLLSSIKRNVDKIQAYHAIIWLSLASYAWDDLDSICGAFYNGTYHMQKIYEKSL